MQHRKRYYATTVIKSMKRNSLSSSLSLLINPNTLLIGRSKTAAENERILHQHRRDVRSRAALTMKLTVS